MRMSDWSSDVCSSDLDRKAAPAQGTAARPRVNEELARADIEKATRMRLLGEDKIYTWEYERCLQRIEARKRVAARRAAARRARQRVVQGTRGSVRVDLGGRRILKKNTRTRTNA